MGGWITDNWSWRWIFYINIPIGIISCFMLMRYIKDPPYLKRIGLGAKVDYWGLALIVVGIGCLQVIMDKGQREDWFSSSLIVRLAIISAVSLIAFVFIELKKKDPILNLRELKNVSFASANLIQFTAFFTLFGSIVLLPLYLQTLMGYTSFLAGFVLAPGGVATLFVMPMVGKMMTKTNPKWILFFGLLINAYSMFTMTRFNLNIDMDMAIWSRVILGVGMGMTFVPLTSLAFRTIPKEDMANASSIYSLLRNIAGSFGIATMTTLLARRAQFHQFHYAENLTPYDPHYQMAIYKATSALTAKAGANAPMAAKGLIYQQLMKQSTLNAFIDSFHVACIIILIVAPLVFFLKNSNPTEKNIMAH
jgi:DHA2 family multidrug resistance protein